MTKKRWKLMVWVFILTLCVCKPVYAAEESETELLPMAVDAEKTVNLVLSSGSATCVCKVKGDIDDVTKITINMYLQKQNSSGGWATYKSWSGTKSSNVYNMSQTTTISKGTYRVRASVTCYKGTSSQTTSNYSTVKTY